MRGRPELVEEECCSSENCIRRNHAKCYQSKRVLRSLTPLIQSRPRSNGDRQKLATEHMGNEPHKHVSEFSPGIFALRIDCRKHAIEALKPPPGVSDRNEDVMPTKVRFQAGLCRPVM